MAFIPDEVIDDMYSELTSGARDLYIYLARCRNQNSGKCNPSISTLTSAINLSRARIYALRKELQEKKWAEFSENNATLLKGFNSPKNKTARDANKPLTDNLMDSLKNKTDSLENETLSLENKTKSLENKTCQSQKQDSHIRKNQQIEPAKEPCEPPSPDFFEEIKSLIITATGEPPVNGNLLRIEQAAVKITQSAGQTALPDLKSFIADQGSKIIKLAFIAGDFCSWNAARKRKAEPEKPKREYTGLTWATMTEEQRASFRN